MIKQLSMGFVASLLGTASAFACLQVGPGPEFVVCPGDKVYKGSSYEQGATVVAINGFRNTATVRSNKSGNIAEENVGELDITRGCVEQVCAGQLVWKGSSFALGAQVMGVNFNSKTATLRSMKSGKVSKESVVAIDVAPACMYGVCTGDLIFKGSSFERGAYVRGVNYRARTVTVQSVKSANLTIEDPRQLSISAYSRDVDNLTRQLSMSGNPPMGPVPPMQPPVVLPPPSQPPVVLPPPGQPVGRGWACEIQVRKSPTDVRIYPGRGNDQNTAQGRAMRACLNVEPQFTCNNPTARRCRAL